jgi:hypothetical protein
MMVGDEDMAVETIVVLMAMMKATKIPHLVVEREINLIPIFFLIVMALWFAKTSMLMGSEIFHVYKESHMRTHSGELRGPIGHVPRGYRPGPHRTPYLRPHNPSGLILWNKSLIRHKNFHGIFPKIYWDFYFRALRSLVVLSFPQLLSFSSVLS